jgi:hypothetical protein
MVTATEIIIRLIVTGIVAIVPSAGDPNVTRLIVPKHMHITPDHPSIPEHYAYIEIHSKNFIPTDISPDFRYHNRSDADGDDRLIFILRSEEVKFGNAPSNTTLTRNVNAPANPLTTTQLEELQSTFYKLRMSRLCPKCGPMKREYFDLAAHPDKVAARMDLRGGHESVNPPNLDEVWTAKGTDIEQPLTQEVVYEFKVPACGQRLLLSRVETPDVSARDAVIALHSPEGEPIDVYFGNAPLLSILRLDQDFRGAHRDDHFALIYDMFTTPPTPKPILQLKPNPIDGVSGPGDNCIPPSTNPEPPL